MHCMKLLVQLFRLTNHVLMPVNIAFSKTSIAVTIVNGVERALSHENIQQY